MLTEELIKQILDILLKSFDGKLASVVLYGSYAENRETPYSDIDILIIVNETFASWREKRQSEVALRKNTSSLCQVSPRIISQKELTSAVENYDPLILNVISSGKVLFDTGVFRTVREYFEKVISKKVLKAVEGYWGLVS